MTVVVDTSVAVAWYLNETFSTEARRWQDRMLSGQDTLLVPRLHFLEFANVLRTYVRRGELDQALALDIYALHLESPLEITDTITEDILNTAFEYEATAYDAAFILLAITQDAPLITAERTTTPWVVRLGKHAIVVS
ncbi:MAG: type II toxin-antitoxin system VapC family toxin [Lentisphaerae bacterium]|nr:type II toxin-antitoxin system VapC family toxin [Lentisphaerota bacterium]